LESCQEKYKLPVFHEKTQDFVLSTVYNITVSYKKAYIF